MEAVEQDRTRFSQSKRFSIRQFVLQYGVYISLTFLLLIGLIATPKLYEGQTLFLVLRQASQLGIVAIGQTLVLLVAGLDLSVTAVIVLTAVTIAQVAGTQDSLLIQAILIAVVLGLVVGLGNGLLITKRNVPPFVATLGMFVLINGAQLAYTKGVPSGQVPAALGILNQGIGPLPVSFVLWIALAALISFVLIMTPYGRKVYAVGANREAARLTGIKVDRTLISIYVLCSLMAVIAGVVLSSYVGYVDRYLGTGLDLDSIAAAVVGGTAFTGGRGNLAGTVAGVLIIQLLSSMTLLLGLNVQLQLVVKGIVIVGAVAFYSIAARRK
jgi:ribose/xylose/arabinose/galactoside ABC-type transport system permease subunit